MKLELYRHDVKDENRQKPIEDLELKDFYWYVDYRVILHCHQVYFIDDDGNTKRFKDKYDGRRD